MNVDLISNKETINQSAASIRVRYQSPCRVVELVKQNRINCASSPREVGLRGAGLIEGCEDRCLS